MTHVSRPLIGLLLATVVFFALWMVALKPRGSSGGAGGSANQGLGQYQADINAAHRAVGTANAASARAGAVPARADGCEPASRRPGAPDRDRPPGRDGGAQAQAARPRPSPTRRPRGSPRRDQARVRSSTRSARTASSRCCSTTRERPDDRAVHQELAGVPTHGGRVFKLAIPLNEIRRYTSITEQLPVNLSPTLVLVAPDRQTDEIVGYADPFEISQRVDDALALR